MHDGMPYGRNQGQGHSREVDRQSPTGLIFDVCVLLLTRDSFLGFVFYVICVFCRLVVLVRLSVPVQVIDWKDSFPK